LAEKAVATNSFRKTIESSAANGSTRPVRVAVIVT
jgi:hypothetical protein